MVLPDELVIDILSRLSVNSLMKFGCVCKSWNALTRDPALIADHMKYSSAASSRIQEENTSMIVKYFAMGGFDVMPFRHAATNWPEIHAFRMPSFDIFGPCNGIMYFYGEHLNPRGLHSWCECPFHALWNPATREFKALPMPYVHPLRPPGFRFHNSVTIFGHDPATNDYKVVKITRGFLLVYDGKRYTHDQDAPSYCQELGMQVHKSTVPVGFGFDGYTDYIAERVEVYSLKKNSWKLVETEKRVTVELYPQCCEYVYLDGFCYWVKEDYARKRHHSTMSIFDMTNEVFSEMALPLETDPMNYGLFVDKGSLCKGSMHAWNVLLVWAMVEEKGAGGLSSKQKRCWIKQSEITLPLYDNMWRVTWKDRETIVYYFQGELVLYDFKNHTLKPLPVYKSSWMPKIVFCPETLVSFKTI